MSRPRADAGGERGREGALSPPSPNSATREGCAGHPDAVAAARTRGRCVRPGCALRLDAVVAGGMCPSKVSAPWADAPVRPHESQDRVERSLHDGEPGRRLLGRPRARLPAHRTTGARQADAAGVVGAPTGRSRSSGRRLKMPRFRLLRVTGPGPLRNGSLGVSTLPAAGSTLRRPPVGAQPPPAAGTLAPQGRGATGSCGCAGPRSTGCRSCSSGAGCEHARKLVDEVGLGIRRTAGTNLGSDQLVGTLALKTTQIRTDERQPAAHRQTYDRGAVHVIFSCRCCSA